MGINTSNKIRIVVICCLLFLGGIGANRVEAQEANSGKTKASVTFYYGENPPKPPKPDGNRKSSILPQTGEVKKSNTLIGLLILVFSLVLFRVNKKTSRII